RPAGADVAERRPVSPAGQRAGPGPCSKGAVPAHSCIGPFKDDKDMARPTLKFNLFVPTAFFALLCLSSASPGADLRPLNGKPISGELVRSEERRVGKEWSCEW